MSVIIPARDRSTTIRAAVDSVLTQTHEKVEVIVVDDGSIDETFAIAAELQAADPRVRLFRHERALGAQAARNTGIRSARGTWLAFLDSDDVYLPQSVGRRLEVARRLGVCAVHSECIVRRVDGSDGPLGTPAMQGDIRGAVIRRPGPTFPGLLVRRDCLALIGELDESIVAYQEWDTAIRLALVTRFGFVSEPSFVWDQRDPGTISNDLRRSVAGYEQIVRKHLMTILRYGGPSTLAAHLLEAARQHSEARDPVRAWTRRALAMVVWPVAVGYLARTVARRIKSHLAASHG